MKAVPALPAKKTLFAETRYLLRHLYLTELRSGNNVSGLLLYALSTVFVCYWSLKHVEPGVWNAVFWIILMFSGINAVAKNFLQESRGQALFFYTLASANAIILSRLIYNTGLLFLIALCSLALYALLLKSPIVETALFLTAIFLGSVSLSSVFTLISAIASRAGSSMTLMAVLGIPLLLPVLYLLIRYSAYALEPVINAGLLLKDSVVLILLNVVVVSVTFMVFPYLWRD